MPRFHCDFIDFKSDEQPEQTSACYKMQETNCIHFKLWLIDEKRQVLGTRLLKYSGNSESLLHQLDTVSLLLTRLETEFVSAFPQLTQLSNVKSFCLTFTDEFSAGAKRDCVLEQGVDLMCVIRTWQRAGKMNIPIDLWFQLPILEEVEIASPNVIRDSVICTECRQRFNGFRYKCLQCPDYILCGPCDQAGKHQDHAVIRLPPAMECVTSNLSLNKLSDDTTAPSVRTKAIGSQQLRENASVPVKPLMEKLENQTKQLVTAMDRLSLRLDFAMGQKDGYCGPVLNQSLQFLRDDFAAQKKNLGTLKKLTNEEKAAAQLQRKKEKRKKKLLNRAHKKGRESNDSLPIHPKVVQQQANVSVIRPKKWMPSVFVQPTQFISNAVENLETLAEHHNLELEKHRDLIEEFETVYKRGEAKCGAKRFQHKELLSVSLSNGTLKDFDQQVAIEQFEVNGGLKDVNQGKNVLVQSVETLLNSNDLIFSALQTMTAMGFSNEDGRPTTLLKVKNGDINSVLDSLHNSQH